LENVCLYECGSRLDLGLRARQQSWRNKYVEWVMDRTRLIIRFSGLSRADPASMLPCYSNRGA
jgi:hypothetical protein